VKFGLLFEKKIGRFKWRKTESSEKIQGAKETCERDNSKPPHHIQQDTEK
jgi:hypothetical protein